MELPAGPGRPHRKVHTFLGECLPGDGFFRELKYEVFTLALDEESPLVTNPSSLEASLPLVLVWEGRTCCTKGVKGRCPLPSECLISAGV